MRPPHLGGLVFGCITWLRNVHRCNGQICGRNIGFGLHFGCHRRTVPPQGSISVVTGGPRRGVPRWPDPRAASLQIPIDSYMELRVPWFGSRQGIWRPQLLDELATEERAQESSPHARIHSPNRGQAALFISDMHTAPHIIIAADKNWGPQVSRDPLSRSLKRPGEETAWA